MKTFIGFTEALQLTLANVHLAGVESLPLNELSGRILSEDLFSKVDCPSVDASLKDGYAVKSQEIALACSNRPVRLTIKGSVAAGGKSTDKIESGQTIRVTTGAPIPEGANAVLAEEFCQQTGNELICKDISSLGQNILKKGSDLKTGDIIAGKGEKLYPPVMGLMAAAGLREAAVYKQPRVTVLAIGDEIVLPGSPLPDGKLYASNLVETCAWLSLYGFRYKSARAGDLENDIAAVILKHLDDTDVIITSGGIWGSEKDLMKRVLEKLGWEGVYHRVKLGPGKGISFGLLENRPFFCLPGGPPSSEMAFLQLTLPALFKMKGEALPCFPIVNARLAETLHSEKAWTKCVHAGIVKKDGELLAKPLKQKSRLQSMARNDGIIIIPENQESVMEGSLVDIQVLPSCRMTRHTY